MQANIIFVVPIDLLAASEMIRTLQDFSAGGAGRYHRGGYGRMAEVFCQAVERYGGRVLLGSRVERIAATSGAVTGVVTDRVASSPDRGEQRWNPAHRPAPGGRGALRRRISELRPRAVPSWGIVGTRYFLSRPTSSTACTSPSPTRATWTAIASHA